MKTLMLMILMLSTAACATLAPPAGTPGTPSPSGADLTSTAPTIDPTPQGQDMSPRLVIPATGGMPVIGIPVGGDLYIPVTGGDPVIGIPTTP